MSASEQSCVTLDPISPGKLTEMNLLPNSLPFQSPLGTGGAVPRLHFESEAWATEAGARDLGFSRFVIFVMAFTNDLGRMVVLALKIYKR